MVCFDIRQEDDQLLVYSVLPVDVPKRRRNVVALYLTRANFGLSIGNSELDLDHGQVRYKTSIDLEGVGIAEPLIDHLFLAYIVNAEKYPNGLTAVISGDDPNDAVAAVESKPTAETRGR